MAGATAAAAAVTPHAWATTAQISLIGNTLDSVTGDNISVSTSPGHPFATVVGAGANASNADLTLRLNGIVSNRLMIVASHSSTTNYARIVHQNTHTANEVNKAGIPLQTAVALIPFTLDDATLPNALPNSDAFLEIEATNKTFNDQTISLLAIYYTESSTTAPDLTINNTTGVVSGGFTNVGYSEAGVFDAVPEPSSLALLALGAGGILARRQRRKAAR